jgi:crotonobetainyl-CoA:carnitine CoA-transferase CaiB-like acyl-CoA transferase
VSVTPFGQTGPYRHYKSTNIVSFALGGIMSLTGDPAREPLVSGGSQAQYLGGCTPSPRRDRVPRRAVAGRR